MYKISDKNKINKFKLQFKMQKNINVLHTF